MRSKEKDKDKLINLTNKKLNTHPVLMEGVVNTATTDNQITENCLFSEQDELVGISPIPHGGTIGVNNVSSIDFMQGRKNVDQRQNDIFKENDQDRVKNYISSEQKQFDSARIAKELINNVDEIEILEESSNTNKNKDKNEEQSRKDHEIIPKDNLLFSQRVELQIGSNTMKSGRNNSNSIEEQGQVYIGKLKNGENDFPTDEIGDIPLPLEMHKSSKSMSSISGQNTAKGTKLWSKVRRDIFFPIRFRGDFLSNIVVLKVKQRLLCCKRVETGLEKKRHQKFQGSQSQFIQSQDPRVFINPSKSFKHWWDVITGMLQIYYPVLVPIRVCFDIKNESFLILDLIIEFFFLLDMFFSCITGTNYGGELIRDRIVLTKSYLKHYFIFDLIMIIPYYLFYTPLSYVKILRLSRYWDRFLFLLHRTVYFIFKGGSSHKFAVLLYYLFKVVTLILLCVHTMACLWIQVGQHGDNGETPDLPEEFYQNGWVNKYFIAYPSKHQNGVFIKEIYISAYYFVTTTIATIGYGDFSGRTVQEQIFTMICEFFGIALFGYISGGLVSAVKISLLVGTMQKNERKNQFDQWLYEREKNKVEPLEISLQQNLRAINHFNQENNFVDFFHESDYYKFLPKEQKRKIFNLLFTDLATFFGSFFRNIPELSMIKEIFCYFHPLTFLPGGQVIEHHTLSNGLYFILAGKVHIQLKSKQQEKQFLNAHPYYKTIAHKPKDRFLKLRPGSFFGEFCILDKHSSFSFIAAGKNPLFTLFISKTKLLEICLKYKETYAWLKKFAFYRFKYFKMEKHNFQQRTTLSLRNVNTAPPPPSKPTNQAKKSVFAKIRGIPENNQSESNNNSINIDDMQDNFYNQDNILSGRNKQNSIEPHNNLNNFQNQLHPPPLPDTQTEETENASLSIIKTQIEDHFESRTFPDIQPFHLKNESSQFPLQDHHFKDKQPILRKDNILPLQSTEPQNDLPDQPKKTKQNTKSKDFQRQKQSKTSFIKGVPESSLKGSFPSIKEDLLSEMQEKEDDQVLGRNKVLRLLKGRNKSDIDFFLQGELEKLNETHSNKQGHGRVISCMPNIELDKLKDGNKPTNSFLFQNKRQLSSTHASQYQPTEIDEQHSQINPPYSFNYHSFLLSPQFQESNHKLTETPLSSENQQVTTRDTLNHQKNTYQDNQGQIPSVEAFSPIQISGKGSILRESIRRSSTDISSENKEDINKVLIVSDTTPKILLHSQQNTNKQDQQQNEDFLIKITNPLPSITDQDEIDEDQSFQETKKKSYQELHNTMNLQLPEVRRSNQQNKQDSQSCSDDEDYMNSQEEDQANEKLKKMQLNFERRHSLTAQISKIKEIKEEERKARLAFRRLSSTSQNKIAIDPIIEENLIVEQPQDFNQKEMFSNKVLKIAQSKMMKKLMLRKIQVLVEQAVERSHTLSAQSEDKQSKVTSKLQESMQIKMQSLSSTSPKTRKNATKNNISMDKIGDQLNPLTSKGLCRSRFYSGCQQDFKQSSELAIEENNIFHEKNLIISNEIKSLSVGGIQGEKENQDTFKQNENLEGILYDDDKQQQGDLKGIYKEDQESRQDKDNEKELSCDSEEAEELKEINQIFHSRMPNFDLMLYINNLMMQHEKEYTKEAENSKNDDYQCYEDIDNVDSDKSDQSEIEDLDDSIDYPVDCAKPSFDLEELSTLSPFLESQITILSKKTEQIINNIYDECAYCIDNLHKLTIFKEAKLKRNESKQNIPIPNDSSAPKKSLLQTNKFAARLLGNKQKPKGTTVQQGDQTENVLDEIETNRINLGMNIQFNVEQLQEQPEHQEFNFFSEIRRIDHINQCALNSISNNNNSNNRSPSSRNIKSIFKKLGKSNKLFSGSPKISKAGSQLQQQQQSSQLDGSLKQKQERNANQVIHASKSQQPFSDQQRIKFEFQRMFHTMECEASPKGMSSNGQNSFSQEGQSPKIKIADFLK